MLIIFDLDDTLIDTSGSITPIQLESALRRMIEEGLPVTSGGGASDMLKRLDRGADSAKSALSEFLEILDVEEKFYPMALEEVYGPIPADLPIFAHENALEVLQELSQHHTLALVTIGKTQQQKYKMEKAGIDSTLFSKIVITEVRDKKPHYESLLEEFGMTPAETIVCGDRIAIDLVPAKELGLKTIHVRQGRGKKAPQHLEREVDFTVTELKQIEEIIKQLC
ncbi:MAG: HAD family hydrolase [Verrucomicrobia bacterium]|nr:HAD family hydrolase [Verrucomicrobiota bacterium]